MPILVMALIALAVFGAIGVLLATAALLDVHNRKEEAQPSTPAATDRKHTA